MTCASCVAHVEKSVSKLEGIQTVQVNLLTNSMTVSYDETALNNDIIEKSVENAGYEAHLKSENTSTAANTKKIDHVQLEQDEMKTVGGFRWLFWYRCFTFRWGACSDCLCPPFFSDTKMR